MTLLQYVARRLEDQLSVVKSVKGAADMKAAKADQIGNNSAYVLLADESAGKNPLANGVRQRVTTGIAVVLAIANYRDQRGEAGLDAVDAVRADVRQALLGWQPSPEHSAMTYRGGRLVELYEYVTWWRDIFDTQALIESVKA